MATEEQKIAQLKKMQRRPSTPGDLLADLMEGVGITQGELAERLGVSRAMVSRLILGQRALSPDMAQRLGRCFGNGPAIWLKFQQQVHMWDALHLDSREYQHIKPLKVA